MLTAGPVELQERRKGRWVHCRYALKYQGAAALATHWHTKHGGTYRVLIKGVVVCTWPDDPRQWTLPRKLRYVRQRLKAQDALGKHHPGKTLSLYPLTVPEALSAILQARPKPSPTARELEQLEWLKAQSALNQVRKYLSDPPDDPDA